MSIRERVLLALRSRLQYKLLLVYSLIFILQCSVLLYSYQNVEGDKKKEMIDQNLKLLKQANKYFFSDVIQKIDRLMENAFVESIFWEDRSLANNDKDYINDNVKIEQILSSMYIYGSYIDSVYLYFNKNEKLYIMDEMSHKDIPSGIYAHDTFMFQQPDMRKYDWYAGALKSKGDMYLSQGGNIQSADGAGGKKLLYFSKSLFNPLKRDELISVISINISYDFFEQLTREVNKPNEKMMIVTGEGTIVYSTDPKEIFSKINPERMAAMSAADTSWSFESSSSGRSILLSDKSEYSGWYMVKEIPYAALMEDVRKNAFTNLWINLGIFVIGITFIMFAAIRITSPIKRIALTMERFEETDNNMETYLHRIDEIGKLNRSFNKMTDKIKYLINSEYKAKLNEKEARLEALQAQINPHFLNNTLQIVSSIAIERNIPEIEKINGALSTILRYSLSKNKELISLRQELNNVDQYMVIQTFRYEDRLEYSVDIGEEVLDCLVPVLTLQPIVENAIKHGMERKIGKGVIAVRSEITEDGQFLLIVEDNGGGVRPEEAERLNLSMAGGIREENTGWNGRGLLNINDRIRYYYGDSFGLRISSEYGQGFQVIVKLPGHTSGSSGKI